MMPILVRVDDVEVVTDQYRFFNKTRMTSLFWTVGQVQQICLSVQNIINVITMSVSRVTILKESFL